MPLSVAVMQGEADFVGFARGVVRELEIQQSGIDGAGGVMPVDGNLQADPANGLYPFSAVIASMEAAPSAGAGWPGTVNSTPPEKMTTSMKDGLARISRCARRGSPQRR
ncbi:MAG: hypothetical protein ACLSTO_13730 [Bilophila wadsworthia]